MGDHDGRREALTRCGMAVAWWARHAADRPAVIDEAHGHRTFAELNGRANQLVRALRRRGLRSGDAVALMSPNRPEWVETWAACTRAGWRLTPVNWHLTADEAAYVVGDCEARAFVADGGLAAAAGAAGQAAGPTACLAIGSPRDGFEDYAAALAGEDTTDIDDPELGNSMLYTSGTTGRPKGVLRPPAPPPLVPQYRGDRHRQLCTGPLYHGGPYAVSLVPPLTNGVGVVLMERFEPEDTLRLIEEHRITHTHMVPTMFHRLLALPESVRRRYDVSSLRYVVHGAAPCPPAVKTAMIEWWGPVIHEYYSSTEGLACVVDAETWLRKPGTVGRPGDQAYVGDDEARRLPAGDSGLVWIRAPAGQRFQYFKDEQKTARTYRGDYFTLGDVGHLDEDGYLFLTDRSANLIISGGVNIYPAEVDAVLLEHPAVADVATIGVPNEEWGEEVKAVVELRPGHNTSAELGDRLIDYCRSRLAHFKCPRSVDFVDRLPRHDSGKLYKRLLRERYRARSPLA